MASKKFLQQRFHFSPYLSQLDLSDLEESLRSEVSPGEIALTLNGSKGSSWSITPDITRDRNNVLFTLAVGKLKSENVFHWKAFRSISVLGLATVTGVIIVTLYSNESIAKLIIRLEENHPFNVEYFTSEANGLVEPWKTTILSVFGPLQGMQQESVDLALSWSRLTKRVDRRAAVLSKTSTSLNSEGTVSEQESMGREKEDPKEGRYVKRAEEKRARITPKAVVPSAPTGDVGQSLRVPSGSAQGRESSLPVTPLAAVGAGRSSLTGKTARPKQMVSKTKYLKGSCSTAAPTLLTQPGLENDDAPGEAPAPASDHLTESVRNISHDILNAGSSGEAGIAIMAGPLSGRVDDILNIMPRELAPKPPKVRLMSEKVWSSNPVTNPVDDSVVIPEDLETEVDVVVTSKKGEDRDADLRKRSLLNEKFTRESDYMYVFGRDQIFELALGHMEPSDHRLGRIYRDYEKAGAEDIKRNLILANYVKPVLTVMPNLDHRPKDWSECVNAGKFQIINGQHTWHAAIACLNDPVLRSQNPRIEDMKLWDVQVVWTDKASHLHALSFKCNEGHNETKHLTSLLRAILHCRVLWESAGKPPLVRKNASTRRKKDPQAIEAADPKLKQRYEAFRMRACQSLSATVKQEQPDKPIRINWEQRGERQIIMSPDDIWEKWESVFTKYEAGDLIDLDTGEEMRKSPNAAELMSLGNITATLLRGLAAVSMQNIGQAADHILSNPPRIFLGKSPKKWHRALSLDKWCERRKWKDVIVRAIGDRIAYIKKSEENMFFTDNKEINLPMWKRWKQEKFFSSTIMQAIYFSEGAENYITNCMSANRTSPEYPPYHCRVAIDQALTNGLRADEVAEGNWSVFVPWKPSEGRFQLQTGAFGVSGKVVPEVQKKFNPKKLRAGIIDLRHFPLVSKDAEETTSWNKIIQLMQVRAMKFGFATTKAWMIIARKERRNVVNILRSHFFPNHRCKHVQYTSASGEPTPKAKSKDIEITYLETPTTFNNYTTGYLSDDYEAEEVLGKQFKHQEFYRAEHKDTVFLDELRMETYIRFIRYHSTENTNIFLGFAGSKALRACRMMKRNSISFEFLRVGTEKLLFKAVSEAPSNWRTYYLPNPKDMKGDKVITYEPGLGIQVLVNYRFNWDITIGGFYDDDDDETVDVRQSQSSCGAGPSRQESPQAESNPSGFARDVVDDTTNFSVELPSPGIHDDDIVNIDSASEDNDIMGSGCSDDALSVGSLMNDLFKDVVDSPVIGLSGQSVRPDTGSLVPCTGEVDVSEGEESGFQLRTKSALPSVAEKDRDEVLPTLQAERARRLEQKNRNIRIQNAPSLNIDDVSPSAPETAGTSHLTVSTDDSAQGEDGDDCYDTELVGFRPGDSSCAGVEAATQRVGEKIRATRDRELASHATKKAATRKELERSLLAMEKEIAVKEKQKVVTENEKKMAALEVKKNAPLGEKGKSSRDQKKADKDAVQQGARASKENAKRVTMKKAAEQPKVAAQENAEEIRLSKKRPAVEEVQFSRKKPTVEQVELSNKRNAAKHACPMEVEDSVRVAAEKEALRVAVEDEAPRVEEKQAQRVPEEGDLHEAPLLDTAEQVTRLPEETPLRQINENEKVIDTTVTNVMGDHDGQATKGLCNSEASDLDQRVVLEVTLPPAVEQGALSKKRPLGPGLVEIESPIIEVGTPAPRNSVPVDENLEIARATVREAEEAWKRQKEFIAKEKHEKDLKLAEDNELFEKKFSRPAKDRIVLRDSSDDDDDDMVRGRLLKTYNCFVPPAGAGAVTRNGAAHVTVIPRPTKPEPEEYTGVNPTSSLPTSSGPRGMDPSPSLEAPPLEHEMLRDVKTEFLEDQWLRKRRAEWDVELTDAVNRKFSAAKGDLLKSIYADIEAGRVQLPVPLPSSRPGGRSEILSGVSNAASPVDVPVVTPSLVNVTVVTAAPTPQSCPAPNAPPVPPRIEGSIAPNEVDFAVNVSAPASDQ